MAIETHVVVLEDEIYTGGVGYRGPVLKELGFPEGPYIFGVAKLFVNQAKRAKTKARFKIVEHKQA